MTRPDQPGTEIQAAQASAGRPATIFVSAAEASGDEHASHLVHCLRQRLPQARIVGLGGPKMAAAGCEILLDVTARASMAGAVLKHLPYFLRMIKQIKGWIAQIRPDVFVPVDSPSLNGRFCEPAKAAGAKVFHYISPQVWAWAPWRVNRLRRMTDHVACILPFEDRYLRDRGVRATYVGHPLFDTLRPAPEPLPDLAEAWSTGAWQVAMLPGSRGAELRNHTAALVHASNVIRKRWPRARCVFAARTDACAEGIRQLAGRSDLDIVTGQTRETLARSHFALAVSGTVTLEVANYGVPMMVVYRANRVLYRLLSPMFRTPHLALVNILSGRRLAPELMPWSGNVHQVAAMAMELMNDLGWLHETRRDLLALSDSLRPPPGKTACGTAADLIVGMLSR